MSENTGHLAEPGQGEDAFEKEMRGYSRRQVDEFVAKARSTSRDLEDRLSHALDENERLRLELSATRQAAAKRPAHEEISDGVRQILKLAEDEGNTLRKLAADEIAKLRNDAKQETDRLRADTKQETDKFRAEAQNQAERMLRAAQEQAENSVASARNEAEKTRNTARAEAERSIAEAHKQSETAVASAKAQAKQVLDEATARATAIHDGAERRLNLLMSRHTEAMRRLTEIRDVVTTLVAGEVSRGSLEDEVEKAVASALGDGKSGAGRGPGSAESRFAGTGTAPAPAAAAGHAGQQAAGRARAPEQLPRTQPAPMSQAGGPSKPSAEHRPGDAAAAAANGQGTAETQAGNPARPSAAAPAARPGNGRAESEGTAGSGRPAGTGEARHAAGSRPAGSDEAPDSTRIIPD